MTFVILSLVERGAFDEDLGTEVEVSKPVVVNTAAVRCLYARKDGKPGTRLTFTDGGGFAVAEPAHVVARLVSGGDVTLPEPAALPAPAAAV